MKEIYWELWMILSLSVLLVFAIVAIILPNWLWSIFYMAEILIGLGINLFVCIFVGLLKYVKE